MAIVSSGSGNGSSVVVTGAQAGDVVVLLAATPSVSGSVDNVPDPSGWERVGVWSSGYGWPRTPGVFGVWWAIAGAGGSLTVSTPFGTASTRWQYVISRGSTTVAASRVKRQNAQTITYPGVDFDGTPYSGDVIYAGGFSPPDWGDAHEPAGSTLREETTFQWQGTDGYRHDTNVLLASSAYTSQSSLSPVSAPARTGGWAITLALGDVAGPDAPAITSPAGSSLDLAAGFDLEWVPSGVQTGYAVRVKKGAGAWAWWDGDGFDSASEVVVTSTQTSITVPAAELTNGGDTWTIEVATKGDMSRPELGVYASRAWTGWGAPTVPTVSVTDVTAGVLDSFTPTISMSGTVAAGASGPHYRVQILDSNDAVLIDTGVLSWNFYTVTVEQGAVLSRRNREDITVRAWTVQNGDQHSAPTSTSLYLDVVTPAAPTVSVTPHHHEVSGLPGTLVEVEPQGVMADGLLEVVRVHDGGSDLIWSGDIAVDGWDVADYLAPTGVAVHYEARVTTADTIPLTSPWGASALVTMGHNCGWVMDPLDPSTAVRAGVLDIGPASGDLRTNAMAPLGQAGWVVHSSVAVDDAGTLTLEVEGDEYVAALRSLLASGRRLFLRGWPEVGVWDKTRHGVGGDIWFRPTGAMQRSRPITGPWSTRHYDVGYVAVDPPQWGTP